MGQVFTEQKCWICKKTFIVYPGWVYKRKERYFCTYHHMREYDRTKRGAKKQDKLTLETREKINNLFLAGFRQSDIAHKLGISQSLIRYYKNRMEENREALGNDGCC